MQLGDITESKIDQSGPPPSGEFTYVDISSVDNKTKRIVEPKRIPADSAPSRARQRLRTGDVLVSMTRPNLNAVALVPSELDGSIGSTGFHVLRARPTALPQWLYYGVQARQFVGAMSELVQGALYPAVRPKDIRAFDIRLPDFDEQHRIVAEIEKQFSRLDEAVANLERARTNLTRESASITNAAAAGGLLGREDEALEHWEPSTLGAIADVIDPNPSHRMPAYFPDGYPLISSENFVGSEEIDFSKGKKVALVTFQKQRELVRIESGDFVLSRIGTIGKTRFLPTDRDYCLSHALVVIKVESQVVNKRWLRYAVSSSRVLSQAREGVQSVGVPDLGMGKIRGFKIAIPPLEVQDRIVAEVDRRLSIVREVEAEVGANLKRAQVLRQAVLARAFAVESHS